MQLAADGDRSRTTWIVVHEGAAFIPVTLGFPPGKSWHTLAEEDGRALVRIEGKRYPVSLRRVESPQLLDALASANSAKYPPAPGSDAGSWYFELEQTRARPPEPERRGRMGPVTRVDSRSLHRRGARIHPGFGAERDTESVKVL